MYPIDKDETTTQLYSLHTLVKFALLLNIPQVNEITFFITIKSSQASRPQMIHFVSRSSNLFS